MNIWVVNPFDQLPNESDVPLRYWTLCRVLAEQGHDVIWWSSDFSHLYKKKRTPCPDTDGFAIRLIPTTPYTENISWARLKNHREFAHKFHTIAQESIQNGELPPPDRIVVSLPPLGVAESAFKIRDEINQRSQSNAACQVIVDIMDAWPETFYRAFPKCLRDNIAKVVLAPMHHSAFNAYLGADKISAVGQTYLDLAKNYLRNNKSKPMHRCYHGTNLDRFPSRSDVPVALEQPLRAVYLGAMGSGYDLETIVQVAAQWKEAGSFPFQIHFAGDGLQRAQLEAKCKELGLITGRTTSVSSASKAPIVTSQLRDRVVFHGYLQSAAISELLLSSQLALVPNRPESLVACPYKAGEYAAAGLPTLSCLGGELSALLRTWQAGTEYVEGDPTSLNQAFEKYLDDADLLDRQGKQARRMAEALFDRTQSYQALSEFILQ